MPVCTYNLTVNLMARDKCFSLLVKSVSTRKLTIQTEVMTNWEHKSVISISIYCKCVQILGKTDDGLSV